MRELKLRNALLRERFDFFLRYAFNDVVGGADYVHGWHLDAIGYQLERIRRRDNLRLIVTLPPRHLKSFTITTAWVAWMLGKDPTRRFICASYGQDLADKHARDCLQIMTTDWYREAFPRTRIARRAAADFETTRGGARLSTSVGGALTGRGADIIIIDDPMKADDVLSPAARAATRNWFFNSLLSRVNRQETGAIILVMQRLHCADLAGDLLEVGGWHELRLAALAEADERVPIGDRRFHFRRAGEALNPNFLSSERLEQIKAQDSYVFSAQYQQQPVPERGNFIDPAWLKTYDELPRGGVVVQSWDTASKEGLTNDWSVGITALWSNGRYYILDVHRERMDAPKLHRAVTRLCEQYRVERLLIEDAASGTYLIQNLRIRRPTTTPLPIACTAVQDKVTRFFAQASRIEAGEVLLPRGSPWRADFVAELVAFPNARHDDQADALSQMLSRPPPQPSLPPIGGEEMFLTSWETDEYDDDPDDLSGGDTASANDDDCLY